MSASTTDLVGRLLFEEESNTLDFKREQYCFSGASEEEKSELLKDILAFANAWRRIDAYILIGVAEVKGGKSTVIGIGAHLDDANVQQFVNGKTNVPVTFAYTTCEYEGFKVGVLRIPVQNRPIFLKKDFGSLTKERVYLRRGSSTDTAKPDEIAQMGLSNGESRLSGPILETKLVHGHYDEVLEKSVQCETEKVAFVASDLPDYGYVGRDTVSILHANLSNLSCNMNYWRELAQYEQFQQMNCKLKLAVQNSGEMSANDVKVTLEASKGEGAVLMSVASDLPCRPSTERWANIGNHVTRSLRSRISIDERSDFWRLTIAVGKILPKETVIVQDIFCVAVRSSMLISLEAKIYAVELSEPKNEALDLHFTVNSKRETAEEFLKRHGSE